MQASTFESIQSASKYLLIMDSANSTCCMTPMFIAANAVGCMPPQSSKSFYLSNHQNSERLITPPTIFELSKDPIAFL